MLAETGISVAFRSHFVRAVKTLNPLEAKLSGFLLVKQITYEAAEQPDEYATKVAAAVHALPTSAVVVVVGHSDTLGPTISQLGGASVDSIADNEFDKLFVLFTGAKCCRESVKAQIRRANMTSRCEKRVREQCACASCKPYRAQYGWRG